MALGSWSLAVLLFQALESLGLRYAWLPLGVLIFEVALSVNIKTYPSSESSCEAPVPVQQVRVAPITGSGSLLHEGYPFTLLLSIQPVQRRAGFFCFPSKRRGWIVLWPWLVGDTSQVRNHSSAMDFLGFTMFIWGFPLFSCFCEISWFSLLFESFIFFFFHSSVFGVTLRCYPTAFDGCFLVFVPGFSSCFLNMGVSRGAVHCQVPSYGISQEICTAPMLIITSCHN